MSHIYLLKTMPSVLHTRYLLICILIFTGSFSAHSQSIITGLITQKGSGKPMSSVTVRMTGTYYGAISDANGKYSIKKIPAGANYTLELTRIGFRTIKKTGIALGKNDTLTLNFNMEESKVSLDKDIIVIGERPLVDVEETQSLRSVGRENIQQMVAENVTDVLTQQTGLTSQNKEIFIRGGRGYEAAYLLDGVSVQDPLAGTGFGLQLSANSLQEVEVITGGFNPEYGQATSGIVNIKTRDGTSKYEGSASYRRAQRLFNRNPFDKDTNSSFATDIAEFTFGGPEPITTSLLPALGLQLPGKFSFFLNFYGNFSDDLAPEFARVPIRSTLINPWMSLRQDNSVNIMGKLSWIISPSMRLAYTHTNSMGMNQNTRTVQTNLEYVVPDPGYQFNYQSNFAGALTYATIQKLNSITFYHSLGPSTLYELRVSNFFTHLKVDANGKNYSEYREPQDIPQIPAEYYETGDSNRLGIIPGDGFFDTGNGNIWREHYMDEWTLRGDLTSYISEKNKIKAGTEFRFQELQQTEIFSPWLGPLGLNNDIFKTNTTIGAFYVQNNISFKGLILNYGLRMDIWAPGLLVDSAIANVNIPTITNLQRESYNNGTFELFGRHWKARLSPRLGVSHPITENQMLFFSYGHFNKLPRPQFVYAKLMPQAANSTFQRYGNPDLNFETTISYELGIRNQLTENDVLTITAYYKDIFDYVTSRRIQNQNPRLLGGSFTTYINGDYARSRGLEIEYKKRIGDWFTGVVSSTYSVVTGKSSSAEQAALVDRGLSAERITEDFMPWDRPLQINATANFIVQKNKPLFDIEGLDNINAYIRFFYQSGMRYTAQIPVIDPSTGKQQVLDNGRPAYRTDEQNPLGAIGQNWWWVELNLQKTFMWSGSRVTFSFEVINLFDNKNSTIINPITGRSYEFGDPTSLGLNDPKYPDLQSPLSPYPFNPARYLTRRTLRFGVSAGF